jgi:hypothetical protein
MEKQEKVLWRYIVATLAFFELLADILLITKPFFWNIVRAGFILVNGAIFFYFVNLKVKIEKYNAAQLEEA